MLVVLCGESYTAPIVHIRLRLSSVCPRSQLSVLLCCVKKLARGFIGIIQHSVDEEQNSAPVGRANASECTTAAPGKEVAFNEIEMAVGDGG